MLFCFVKFRLFVFVPQQFYVCNLLIVLSDAGGTANGSGREKNGLKRGLTRDKRESVLF